MKIIYSQVGLIASETKLNLGSKSCWDNSELAH